MGWMIMRSEAKGIREGWADRRVERWEKGWWKDCEEGKKVRIEGSGIVDGAERKLPAGGQERTPWLSVYCSWLTKSFTRLPSCDVKSTLLHNRPSALSHFRWPSQMLGSETSRLMTTSSSYIVMIIFPYHLIRTVTSLLKSLHTLRAPSWN